MLTPTGCWVVSMLLQPGPGFEEDDVSWRESGSRQLEHRATPIPIDTGTEDAAGSCRAVKGSALISDES